MSDRDKKGPKQFVLTDKVILLFVDLILKQFM